MLFQRDVRAAIAALPTGVFIMTAAHEDHAAGLLVKAVSACADEPPLIAVAARKGSFIEPLIRDAHTFAVCLVSPDDRLLLRKFRDHVDADMFDSEAEPDPFAAFDMVELSTGAPIFAKSKLALDCEVVRHFDLEADHELYIGQVIAARVHRDISGSSPA